ncbi:MAG: hypothetical protein M1142_04310 [Patescibacteria group bacterium]|nr:hypothetical protein [Patescibacteria group bacterium]
MGKVGKPPISQKKIELIFRKLEPYLRCGISIHRACQEAKITKSTVYDLLEENSEFAEIVEACKKSFTVLINDIILMEVKRIADKKGNKHLTAEDRKFIQWVAVNNKNMHEFYGNNQIIEDKTKSKYAAIYNDPKAISTVLKTYEIVRRNIIEENGGSLPEFLQDL